MYARDRLQWIVKKHKFLNTQYLQALGEGEVKCGNTFNVYKRLGLDNDFKLNYLAEPPLKKWLSKNK